MTTLRCLAAVLLASLFASVSCSRAPAAAPPKTVTLWRHVQTWSGQASLQTESFLSETGAFKIHWTAKNETAGEQGRLKITLHSAISGRPLIEVVDFKGEGDQSTFVTEDPREFFLVMDAEKTSWTLDLEEGVLAYERPAKR